MKLTVAQGILLYTAFDSTEQLAKRKSTPHLYTLFLTLDPRVLSNSLSHPPILTTMSTVLPLSAIMDPSWASALEPVEPTIRKMGQFLRDEAKQGIRTLPAGDRIFAAFRIPVDQVKVLIVGQDPYPTPGNAIGLSFAVAPGVAIPASVRNIYKELVDDLGVAIPDNGDLTPWTHQGVMLLNRCLSVEAGKSGSHRGKGWEEVTDRAIEVLNSRRDSQGKPLPLVAILWGRDARSLAPRLTNAFVIESAHPSPLSARNGFFGSHPFSRTNEALVRMGAQPVDWSLPSHEIAEF